MFYMKKLTIEEISEKKTAYEIGENQSDKLVDNLDIQYILIPPIKNHRMKNWLFYIPLLSAWSWKEGKSTSIYIRNTITPHLTL